MALGAGPSRVLRDILGSALGQTGVGLIVGLPVAVLATRALSSLLYGADPRNPIAFGLWALVLLVSAALAAVVPARRAAAIEPTRALRAD